MLVTILAGKQIDDEYYIPNEIRLAIQEIFDKAKSKTPLRTWADAPYIGMTIRKDREHRMFLQSLKRYCTINGVIADDAPPNDDPP
jgi:hypothetical protein